MLSTLGALLRALLYGWVPSLVRIIQILLALLRGRGGKGDDKSNVHCFPIRHPAFMRPDPLLYSQRALMAKGLAVTWDNPDINLSKNGVPVSSSQLQPATTYDVGVRVWNNSYDAPAVGTAVHVSYLDFGVGTQSIAVGNTTVDVGVKGSAAQPAFASVKWTTPSTPGHYCLQVLLDPADDTDLLNNLGQENTDVVAATSPAQFTFTLRNDTPRPRRYRFETDSYAIPALPSCNAPDVTRGRSLDRHRREHHPVPAGFTVAITPDSPSIAPGAAVTVQVSVTPHATFVGRQPVNVNCFHERGFAGGVTLTVTQGV